MKNKYEIGKKFKIVGEVAAEHGDCLGDIIVVSGVSSSSVWFTGLLWTNFSIKGEYILSYPEHLDGLWQFVNDDESYFDWLDTVLEEVK